MWSEIYSWKVADAVREGKAVFALDLNGEEPILLPLEQISVTEFFELQQRDKSVAWYVREEENDGESD